MLVSISLVILLMWLSRTRVCVSVRSFLPPCASRPRNIGTYVFTATRKTLLYIIIVIFAENASFRSYGVICLLTTPEQQNTDTKNPCNMGMTLLFAILTKNATFRSYSAFIYLLRAHILHINMRTYITIVLVYDHEHELSGCVRVDAYN